MAKIALIKARNMVVPDEIKATPKSVIVSSWGSW